MPRAFAGEKLVGIASRPGRAVIGGAIVRWARREAGAALTFNGTTSATPHVAGVAALVLEANPHLTLREVVAIIEKTARKVGPYAYRAAPGRPNGDWHREMGYGLVDANACVRDAKARCPKK